MAGPGRGLGVTAAILISGIAAAQTAPPSAQTAATTPALSATPPTPIPTPPIPDPAQFRAAPKINLGKLGSRPVASVDLPDAPRLDRVAVPPMAAITPADRNDLAPPPLSADLTGPPPTVSPGADTSQIEEVAFIVDPAVSQFSAAAMAKLGDVARELARDPAARLEVRAFTPVKSHSESAARRLSLARFLAVRDILKRDGVDDSRIDGRPLTSEPNELNADRIELYIER
jgi:outer membrane protein OmpA-like peptidoglycan-associated protein